MLIFLKFISQNVLGCVRDRAQVTKTMIYLKLESGLKLGFLEGGGGGGRPN